MLPLDPQTFADNGLVNNVLTWAIGEISRAHIQLALSMMSIQETNGTFTPVTFADALAPLGQVAIKAPGAVQPDTQVQVALTGYSAQFMPPGSSGTPAIKYFAPDGTLASTMWLTTSAAIRSRIDHAATFNVAGIALLDAAAPGLPTGALGVVASYKVNQPADAKTGPLSFLWRVASQGKVIAEATGAPGTPFFYKTGSEYGSLQFSADIAGAQVTLGPALLRVASATPLPTMTPTLEPTATPTPLPTATKPPATKVVKAAVPAVSGKISGGFETGGQVQALNGGTISAMKRAHMKWEKRQVQNGDGVAGSMIQEAHNAGFKLLLSVVGDHNRVMDPGYQDQYAAYVGGLAGQGADAIEIWNEMNIDREWPRGQINPTNYVQLLSRAYRAIKAKNPNTMVISGALSPTGAEGAFGTDRVWNDDKYYAGMASAGAGQFLDCVGVHYNEGIVSPTQVGGDPRDSYPTRYLKTMLDRAVAPFGGKPACFTEIGYLTREGYGGLPAGFEWAQNTTVAQQAAWLAQAAVVLSGSGRARLMIVFNVDFVFYGADPMAGFAMIRPGGACPACDTLRQVSQ
jgi:hypothetical protein